jgi:hypothetical protein
MISKLLGGGKDHDFFGCNLMSNFSHHSAPLVFKE